MCFPGLKKIGEKTHIFPIGMDKYLGPILRETIVTMEGTSFNDSNGFPGRDR